MIHKLIFPVLILSSLTACNEKEPLKPADNYNHIQIGEINDSDVREISGMAQSRLNPDVLWVMNDSGDGANLYALSTSGEMLGSVKVKNADNVDWEDLALFNENGISYLLIADTGGNTSLRDEFDIYIVREPTLTEDAPGKIELTRKITFAYQDEPQDCEAVAVDADAGKIYLLSKRSVPAILYELPLNPENNDVQTAQRLGEVTTIPQPTPDEIQNKYDEYHAQPTGMDISPNGNKIAVLTYRRLFIWEKATGESWLEVMNSTPTQIEYPEMEQAEAICFYNDGASVLVTSEKIPAPIYEIMPKTSM